MILRPTAAVWWGVRHDQHLLSEVAKPFFVDKCGLCPTSSMSFTACCGCNLEGQQNI
jgi:hypothetical protein